jgi:hypothetical protein
VIGNERLTALAGAVLLVLIVIELVTLPDMRALLSVHVLVGVLLAGPLAVKIGSTGYRFMRYYTGSPAFVRRGPPHLGLRLLAPLLLATTLVMIGSGIGLIITGPNQAALTAVHGISSVAWLPMIAVHGFAHIRRVPRLIADDWRRSSATQATGRTVRTGVSLGALVIGAIAAILVYPAASPWFAWMTTGHAPGPAFIIVGIVLAALALLATRPFRWK